MSETTTETLSPVEEPHPRPSPAGSRVPGARPAAVVFLVTITVPLVAYLLGVRAPATENRTPTPAPALAEVAQLDDASLAQLTDHLSEVVPGRQYAIRADALIDRQLFGQSPNDEVLLGEDGWLFLRDSVDVHCRTEGEVAHLRAELERAHDLVARTGRDLRVIVPPNKATIYPDRLGESAPVAACGMDLSTRLRRMLESDPPAGYLPFWADVEALRDAESAAIYLDSDTHWTTAGSVAMVRRLVSSFDPALLDDVEVVPGETLTYESDLGRLIGIPERITEVLLDLRRPGVEWSLHRPSGVEWLPVDTPEMDASVLRATGDEVVPGRTVMVHDSFAFLSRAQMAPFFAELAMVRKHPVGVTWVAEAVAAADHVVLEVVERSLWREVIEHGLVASLAVALQDDLPHRTVTVSPDEDGWFTLDPAGADVLTADRIGERPSGAPYALEVEVADGDPMPVDRRPEVRTDAPLTFDLRDWADRGAQRYRIIDGDGTPLRPTAFTLIATR